MDFIYSILLLLLGMLVGFYSGLLGTGGNVFLIPALEVLFIRYGIEGTELVKFIIAQSLFITIFLSMSVSYRQYRVGNFHFREIITVAIPGMITALIATHFIKESNWYDEFYFKIVFLFILILLAVRMIFFKGKIREATPGGRRQMNTKLIILGAMTGIITSVSGLGGGVLLIPYLTDVTYFPLKKASSISIGVIMFLALAVSASYATTEASQIHHVLPWQMGYISVAFAIPILIGVLIASALGVKVAQRSRPGRLRYILGIVIAILSCKMAYDLLVIKGVI